jgi:hypothetical protein
MTTKRVFPSPSSTSRTLFQTPSKSPLKSILPKRVKKETSWVWKYFEKDDEDETKVLLYNHQE